MASENQIEEDILELDVSSSSLEPVTDCKKIDEDLSYIEDEMLLLSSPSPPATGTSVASKTTASSGKLVAKRRGKNSKFVDEDDELEIIGESKSQDLQKLTKVNRSDTENELDDSTELIEEDSESEESVESEDSVSCMDGKINIYYCHGALLLWNADDVQMLREECRIVGKLTGCLPRAPRQNNQLGLPLQLMPEEGKLLVDIDAAVVVKEQPVTAKALELRDSAFKNVRQTHFKIQQELYKENRKQEVTHRLDDILAGKRAKKRKLQKEGNESIDNKESGLSQELKQQKTKELSEEDEDDADDKGSEKDDGENKKDDEEEGGADTGPKTVEGNGVDDSNSGSKNEHDDIDQLTVDDIVAATGETSEKHALVQIFTENPWKRTVSPCTEWFYPDTEKDLLRFLVFKDLWGKGFYLTSGAKFGGDFLVYPGDPARYHSHYIAVCKNQHGELPCLDIITLGRLASNVRKTALLCTLDKNWKVIYTSLQWTGIS